MYHSFKQKITRSPSPPDLHFTLSLSRSQQPVEAPEASLGGSGQSGSAKREVVSSPGAASVSWGEQCLGHPWR